MNRFFLLVLAAGFAYACGGGGSSTDTGAPDTADTGVEVEVAEEVVVKECTKADDCLAVLGAAGQCDDLVCDEADWTCKRVPKEAGTACSDGDPCTKNDACDDQGQCVAGTDQCTCRSTDDCAGQENGDLCDGTLKCDLSSLPYKCILDTTTVVTCSHENDTQCATTECVPATGACELTPVDDGTACSDGDVCSDPDTCQAGECKGTDLGCECTDDLDCMAFDDGDLCTGYYICDKTALPYACIVAPNSVVTCSPADDTDCQKNQCEPATGNCQMGPAPTGSPCDDGNFCTDSDGCAVDADTGEGVCKGGTPHACDDGNACTNDGCDKIGQKCTYVFNNGPCEDYNKCLTGDTCQYGMCQGGTTPVNCDDQDACTADSCEIATGCKHVARNCDDGDPCTVDGCDAVSGACTYKPYLCGDGDLCTTDTCVAGQGCVFAPKDCSDGDLCTTDACVAENGSCTHAAITCVDEDPCTDQMCDGATGLCVYPAKVCDDGDACTADGCDPVSGECTFAAVAIDDADACTADACDPATGVITHEPKDCSDGDLCTTDTCDPLTGDCANPAVDCDDDNPCTVDACSQGNGECVQDSGAADNTACDDGYAFTDNDLCLGGVCAGTVTQAPTLFRIQALQVVSPDFVADLGGGPTGLNDALGTLASGLLGPDGYGESLLSFAPLPADFGFERAVLTLGRGACLYDADVATHCGLLPAEPAVAFPDVSFDATGACSDDPAVGAPCYAATGAQGFPLPLPVFDAQGVSGWSTGSFDVAEAASIQSLDGYLLAFVATSDLAALRLVDPDTGLDVAAADALAHLAPEVHDGVEGHWLRFRFQADVVAWFPAGEGCNAAGASCDDGDLCTTDACDPLTAQCGHAQNTCDDGDLCTADACDPATGLCSNVAPDCDDHDTCTTDGCDPLSGLCQHLYGDLEDGDLCTADSCDPLTGLVTHDPRNCDDQNGCTLDSCDPLTGNCVNDIGWSPDADPCTLDACDPATGIVSQTPVDCDDGNPCTDDSCESSSGTCLHVPKTCDDTDPCTTDSCDVLTGDCGTAPVVCNDGNSCTADACNPSDGQCTATPLNDGDACDDGDSATVDDTCTSGVCSGTVPSNKYVFSREVRWLSPALSWDFQDGAGVQPVTAAVGAEASKHIVAGGYDGSAVPTPLFAVNPYVVGAPSSSFFMGYGTCDDAAVPPVVTCTPDFVLYPITAMTVTTWATTGNCVDTPAVPSPCFSTASDASKAVLFGSTTLAATSLWYAGSLGADPYDTITGIDALVFLSQEAAAAAMVSISETERQPLSALITDAPETIEGVTGWLVRVQYVTQPFGILGQQP